MQKGFRHGQILKLIRAKVIHTQEQLAQELRSLGVPATQVTLSRDIKELGLAKTGDGYRQIEPETVGPDIAAMAAEFLQDVRVAQNLVVLKTLNGHASSLAVALDREDWPEITGTIAGDDTVLVIAPDAKVANDLRTKLLGFIR